MMKAALLIGVSEYESGFSRLPSATKDIKAVQRVLLDPRMGGFQETEVITLADPGSQEMREALEAFFADRKPDDLLLFYFSGHGVKGLDGRFYSFIQVI